MYQLLFSRQLIVFTTLLALIVLSPAAQAAPQVIYDDALAASWADYSWAAVNLNAAAPVHNGSKSIAVTYGAWEGLYLAHPGLNTAGFTKLRFFIHGGSAGGQLLQVYAVRAGDSGGAHGPEIQIPPVAANTWTEIQVPLGDLDAVNTSITGITWQDRTGGSQPTLAGQWQVSVAAYDAMGHLSPASNVIIVTTTVNAARVFLPLILVEK